MRRTVSVPDPLAAHLRGRRLLVAAVLSASTIAGGGLMALATGSSAGADGAVAATAATAAPVPAPVHSPNGSTWE